MLFEVGGRRGRKVRGLEGGGVAHKSCMGFLLAIICIRIQYI